MDTVDFSAIFMTEEESDVELHLLNEGCDGQNLVFPAHRFVLTRASVMFKSMIDDAGSEVKEENNKPILELRVKGKLSAALAFARYFYTKKLDNLVEEDYIALMKTANSYQITDLFSICETQLIRQLRPNSVCEVYESLNQIASKNFRYMCIYFMTSSAFIIFTENYHLILKKESMTILLKSDELNVLDENQALGALVSWGKIRSAFKDTVDGKNITEIVAELLPLIRWPFVTEDVKFSSWLDLAEEKKLFEADCTLRQYKAKMSLVSHAEVLSMSKMRRIEEMSHFRAPGTYDLFMFTVHKNVLLLGLTLDMIRLKKTLWNQDVQLFCNKEDLKGLVKSAKVLKYDFDVKSNEIYTYRVQMEFTKPIILCKCHLNIIEAKVNTEREIAFPEFSLKSLTFPLPSTNKEPLFNFHSKVLSLHEIYYFNT